MRICYTDLPLCQVHVNVLDTISGKVVYRITHAPGSGPVEVAIAENNIVYSYWNAQYKRQELSSLGLYEGIIDKYGLTPFATHASAAAAAVHTAPGADIHSAFTAQIPLGTILLFPPTHILYSILTILCYTHYSYTASQRTYILPKAVRALGVTETGRGIAHKNLLLALAPGQVHTSPNIHILYTHVHIYILSSYMYIYIYRYTPSTPAP